MGANYEAAKKLRAKLAKEAAAKNKKATAKIELKSLLMKVREE